MTTTSFEASSGEPARDKPTSTAPPSTPRKAKVYGVSLPGFDFPGCGCVAYKGEIVQGCEKHRRRY